MVEQPLPGGEGLVALCMLSHGSRYGRQSITGISMSPWNTSPEV